MASKRIQDKVLRNMKRAKKSGFTFESLSEDIIAHKAPMKAAYIVECSVNNPRLHTELDRASNIMVDKTKHGIRVLCPDWKEVQAVLELMNNYEVFDMKSLTGHSFGSVKIVKYTDIMNDSLQEHMNESANTPMMGEFITDFTYTQDPLWDEAHMLAVHTKYLEKHNIDFETIKERYSTKIIIRWNNEEEYETVVKWVAWDMGYIDQPSQLIPVADREEVEEILAEGKNCIW